MKNTSVGTNRVLAIIKKYGPVRSSDISKLLGVSLKNIYKHLKKLKEDQLIKKTGETPTVFYSAKEDEKEISLIKNKDDQLVEQNYIYVSPSGEMIEGVSGFREWCEKNNFDFEKEKKLFSKKLKIIQKIKKNGLILSKKDFSSIKSSIGLDKTFFSDFYTVDHFGKTKLGQLVYLGKNSQNIFLIKKTVEIIRPDVLSMIEKNKIKFVCIVPPTIARKVQFMEAFKKYLQLDLPEIKAIKIPSLTKVPQKTLRKLEDRISNAKDTIAVIPKSKIDGNVLILDDATGSGSTMNETAKKIRIIAKKKIKIFGYSVVGSFKGFDVISEV